MAAGLSQPRWHHDRQRGAERPEARQSLVEQQMPPKICEGRLIQPIRW